MNYGYVVNTYAKSFIVSDLTYLKNLGFAKLRVALPAYNTSAATIIKQQEIVTTALDMGFYVIWGVCAPTNFTDVQWAAFKAYVTDTIAPWAQSLNNENFELSIGNEEEALNNGANAPDDATVRSDIRSLATTIQGIYTVGNISYQAPVTNIADWISEGIGDLDKIGFNIYLSLNNFYTNVKNAFDAFGVAFELTEWNVQSGFKGSPNEDMNEKEIRDRLQIIKDLGVGAAYFFTYNHSSDSWGIANWGTDGNFSILKEDGTEYRQAFNALLGGRRTFNSY